MAEKTILCTRKNNRKKHLNVTVLFSQFFKKQMYCRAIRELRRATEGAVRRVIQKSGFQKLQAFYMWDVRALFVLDFSFLKSSWHALQRWRVTFMKEKIK